MNYELFNFNSELSLLIYLLLVSFAIKGIHYFFNNSGIFSFLKTRQDVIFLKPFFTCTYCMASVYGLYYILGIIYAYEHLLFWLSLFIPALSGILQLLTRYSYNDFEYKYDSLLQEFENVCFENNNLQNSLKTYKSDGNKSDKQ